jgi:hypothetical protein
MNGVINVNTTGIRTDTNCAIPNQLLATSSDTGLMTISATSVDGCSLEATFHPQDADQPYRVMSVPNCGVNTSSPAFHPVRQSPPFSLWVALGCSFRLGVLLVLGTRPNY